MAKQIIQVNYHHLRNAELLRVFLRLCAVFGTITAARIVPLALAFKAAVEAFDALMRQIAGTVETRDMKPFARERSVLLTDLFRAVDHGLHSPVPATLNAANHLDLVTRAYHDAGKKPQDEQTQLIDELLKDLTAPETMPYLGFLPSAKTAASQLEAANKTFERLYDERMEDAAKHVTGGTQLARENAEAVCREIVRVINSAADYLDDGSLDKPIDDATVILTDAQHIINRLAGQRHGEEDGSGEGGEAAPISE